MVLWQSNKIFTDMNKAIVVLCAHYVIVPLFDSQDTSLPVVIDYRNCVNILY